MESKRILIADDDALFRRDLREALMRMGHETFGVAMEGPGLADRGEAG